MSKVYSHFGDLGDVLAALATIHQLGAGELVLYPAGPNRVREQFDAAKVERCRSFFEVQDCITACHFSKTPRGLILDSWRKRPAPRQNLADMVSTYFNVPHWDRHKPWCRVDRVERVAPVVIHRSPRYHAKGFPWQKIVERTKGRAVFVGSKAEHAAFVGEFGEVPYHPTPTLLELARVIAGASLFVGNQSAPHMLAEALKRPKWMERDMMNDNCHWERSTAWYADQWPSGPNVVTSRLPTLQQAPRDLTVLVVAWGRPQLLDLTLRSIKAQLSGLESWVVVADNQSSEDTRAVCRANRVDYWPIEENHGLNWPVEHLLAPCLNSEYVCISDADLFYDRPFIEFIDMLRANPHVTYAKGLDSPEHPTEGQLMHNGQVWATKATERGGGVIMRSDTLRAALPLPQHLIDFDWHLCRKGASWAVLPGTVAHLGHEARTMPGDTSTPEKYLYQDGRIVAAHA